MFAFWTWIPKPTPNTGFKKTPEFTSPVVSATCVPTDRFPRIETQLAAQCPFARPTHPPRVNPNAHCLTHISQTLSQKLRQFDPGTIWTRGTIGSDLCFCSSMCPWIRRPSATFSSQSKPHLALPFIKKVVVGVVASNLLDCFVCYSVVVQRCETRHLQNTFQHFQE